MGRISVNIGGGGGASSDEVTAVAAQVLEGKTYVGSDTNDESGTGTMPDQGAKTATLGAGESYSIPAGYHNGNGKVSAKTLEQITAAGTITSAEQILSGYKAYSDGVLYTGTMPDQGHVDATLSAGDTLKLPKGYYSDNGVVTVKPLSELTAAGTAAAAQILKDYKAYVKGSLITGSMPNLSTDTEIDYSSDNVTPVIEADQIFLNTNSDGTKRICLRYAGAAGYLQGNTLFGYPASEFGDVTAAQILKGKKATSANGLRITGIVEVSSVLSFSVAAYSTTQLLCTWKNPAQASGKPFSGVIICAKAGSYPTSPNDGFMYMGSGSNSTAQGTGSTIISGLTAGTTYYVRIWAYCVCSAGNYTVNETKVLVSEAYMEATAKTTASGRKAFTTSGTWTVPEGVRSIHIHCTGGGGTGRRASKKSSDKYAGGGGGGGYTTYQKDIPVNPGDIVTFVVGAGGTVDNNTSQAQSQTGGNTTVSINNSAATSLVANGGYTSYASGKDYLGSAGGSGGGGASISGSTPGAGGSNGSNGNNASGNNGAGQGTTTYEFGDSSKTLYAGGGGGGGCEYYNSGAETDIEKPGGAGGSGGGGKGCGYGNAGSAGSAGTGGGGGGGKYMGYYSNVQNAMKGSAGGSGNVIIAW